MSSAAGEKDFVFAKKDSLPDFRHGGGAANADFFGKNRRKREVFILFAPFPFFEC